MRSALVLISLLEIENILRSAEDLLSDPRRWSRKSRALDEEGREVSYDSPEAVRWSIRGAIMRESKGCSAYPFAGIVSELERMVDELSEDRGYESADALNEHAAHVEVVTVLNEAIFTLERLRRLDERLRRLV